MRKRKGDNWALVTLGNAGLIRVLAQPRPKQLAQLQIQIVDIHKAMASTGMFNETWKFGKAEAEREYALLVADRDRLWSYSKSTERHHKGWHSVQTIMRARASTMRMSDLLASSQDGEGQPLISTATAAVPTKTKETKKSRAKGAAIHSGDRREESISAADAPAVQHTRSLADAAVGLASATENAVPEGSAPMPAALMPVPVPYTDSSGQADAPQEGNPPTTGK